MAKAIFFYDGDCGFCNATVLFLLKRTSQKSLLFCSLQSDYAKKFFERNVFKQPDLTTAYLFHNDRLYKKSSAILRATALSYRPIKHIGIFLTVPLFIRDGVYDLVSSLRKQIQIGKKNNCRFLSPQERERFLSS